MGEFMDKIKIGIPKAFLYYRYSTLWKTFFEDLNCKIILSNDTTKETIELGKKYSIDESCLSSKIYIGHVASLQNKCDYILIPRVENYGKNEKVCVKFNATYDIVKNLFPKFKILEYNIDKKKNHFIFISFLKIGLKINKNPIKVIKSYIKANKKSNQEQIKLEEQQKIKLRTDKLKVLIVSHPYNIYDNYIGKPVIEKFAQEGNFEEAYLGIFAYDKNVISYIDSSIDFNSGIYVAQISSDGPSHVSGLKTGDIITKIDEITVNKMSELRKYIYTKNVGDEISLTVLRNNKERNISIKLGRKG